MTKPQPRNVGATRCAIAIAIVVTIMIGACADTPRSLLSGATVVPAEIQQACTFTTTKCSHCHPIERVVLARGVGIDRWQMTVEQMRLKPSSGISLGDTEVVFRCLRFIEDDCLGCKKQGRS